MQSRVVAAQWRLFWLSDHIRNTDASVQIWDGQSDNRSHFTQGLAEVWKWTAGFARVHHHERLHEGHLECVLVNLLYIDIPIGSISVTVLALGGVTLHWGCFAALLNLHVYALLLSHEGKPQTTCCGIWLVSKTYLRLRVQPVRTPQKKTQYIFTRQGYNWIGL